MPCVSIPGCCVLALHSGLCPVLGLQRHFDLYSPLPSMRGLAAEWDNNALLHKVVGGTS